MFKRTDEIVKEKVRRALEELRSGREQVKEREFTTEEAGRFSDFYSDFRDDTQDAYLYRHSYETWKENQLRKYKEREDKYTKEMEIVSRIMRDYKLSDTEWVFFNGFVSREREKDGVCNH